MSFSDMVNGVLLLFVLWAGVNTGRSLYAITKNFLSAYIAARNHRIATEATTRIALELSAEREMRLNAERTAEVASRNLQMLEQSVSRLSSEIERPTPLWSQIFQHANNDFGGEFPDDFRINFDAQEALIDLSGTHPAISVWVRPQDSIVVHYGSPEGEHLFWCMECRDHLLFYPSEDPDTEVALRLPVWLARKLAVECGHMTSFPLPSDYSGRIQALQNTNAPAVWQRPDSYIMWPSYEPEPGGSAVPPSDSLHAPATAKGRILRNRGSRK